MNKPLALIDIDGVISLFGFDTSDPPAGQFLAVEGIVHLVSAQAGAQLRRLAGSYELAWCSGWEEKANDHLPSALGLPQPLPHVTFDCGHETLAHWKLGGIDAFVGADRAIAWVDDAHCPATREWAARRTGPTRLVETHPATGLTDEHVEDLLEWARALKD
jgi:hypothetical protein